MTVTPTPMPSATPTIGIALALASPAATSTPAPLTPEPTATPTVTPTPVTHTVVAGDSLLGIADRYDVRVPLLQEANGILDPRVLQVGQELIIPSEDDASPEAAQTPTPTPLPVRVAHVNLVETGTGGIWVFGEIINSSGQLLEQVRGGVTLRDASEAILISATALSVLDLVQADEAAPFAILIAEPPRAYDGYAAFAAGALPGYAGSYYRDLAVRDVTGAPISSASYSVSGTVFNVGAEEAVEVDVVLTAYDSDGKVIAVRQIAPQNRIIPPGGNVPFEAVLTPLGGPVARVAALAQGRRFSAAQTEP